MTSTRLHVIALISGGKDSLFSILHCLANGHTIVALANLHPPLHAVSGLASAPAAASTKVHNGDADDAQDGVHAEVHNVHGSWEEGDDLNSFMYQTVGHSIIPLYQDALGIPLYRHEICGSAVNERKEYAPPPRHETTEHTTTSSRSPPSQLNPSSEQKPMSRGADAHQMSTRNHDEMDETESLMPLLRMIMKQHPEANAISTGAILSNYQRTRVESVALRLGLTPLSYLWQYPSLPPYAQSSLLRDMMAVDQDSRIIKVASGGLDDSFLGENVANPRTIARLERAVARFGGEGAVLGEGGEFETLAIDGPGLLWKKRIEVILGESLPSEGGSAAVKFKDARTVEKEQGDDTGEIFQKLRIPRLLDDEFFTLLPGAQELSSTTTQASKDGNVPIPEQVQTVSSNSLYKHNSFIPDWQISHSGTMISIANMIAQPSNNALSVSAQLTEIISSLKHRMNNLWHLSTSNIVLTTIILRNMSDFASVNTIYGAIFSEPLPPARVTIACGDILPEGTHIMLSMLVQNKHWRSSDHSSGPVVDDLTTDQTLSTSSPHRPNIPISAHRIGLHVQSRSYWAPANIGPYSQAISHPLSSLSSASSPPSLIHIAGQIPLDPASMTIPSVSFLQHTLLSLQHLFRIGRAMETTSFLGAVAVLEGCEKNEATRRQQVVQEAWKSVHEGTWKNQKKDREEDGDAEEDEEFDIWNVRHGATEKSEIASLNTRPLLPDWARVEVVEELGESESHDAGKSIRIPPVFTVMLCSGSGGLPLGAPIEWVGLGAAHATIRIDIRRVPGAYVLKILDSNFSIVWIPIRNSHDFLQSQVMATQLIEGRQDAIWTVYVAGEVDTSWLIQTKAAVVPCERVWGAKGEELLGIAMIRSGG